MDAQWKGGSEVSNVHALFSMYEGKEPSNSLH